MKKIGFIDYYLDEWHANNYPAFIAERSGGKYAVSSAYASIDAPHGMTNAQWSEKYKIPLKSSIEEVIEEESEAEYEENVSRANADLTSPEAPADTQPSLFDEEDTDQE